MQLSTFSTLFIYIRFIISGDTEGLAKFKELKSLFRTFKPSKFRYITQEKRITNLFLQKIYSLYMAISGFNQILLNTIFNSDEKKSMLYINYFVESYLSEEIRSKREKFTKDMMWQRIMESDNVSKSIKDLENEFISYKKYLNKKSLPRIESEYFLLYKLSALCTFNFELFFSKFDTDYNGATPPVYSPVLGEDILVDIEDLYFLISSLPTKIDISEAFEKLYTRTQGTDSKSLAKKSQHSLNKAYKIINDELPPMILLNLCRYITEDIRHTINIQHKFFSILDKYKKEIENRFMRNKQVVLEQYSEKSLQHDIHTLFKGKSLLKIEGYTEGIRKTIESNNFDPISGIQAIKITKTFILELYEKTVKEHINTLILEGYFTEKEYQTEFSNVFFAANELVNVVADCESKLSSSGKYSFDYLMMLLKNYKSNSKVGENKISMQIDTINERIRYCNEKCANILFKLASNIYNMIQDYKSQKPTFITNIKSIKGSQNKEFIGHLASSYNDIAKYVKLIKNFIIVKSNRGELK